MTVRKMKKIETEIDITNDGDNYSEPRKSSKKINKMTFDAYFQIILKNGLVQSHHKAPLRKYMASKGLKFASLADWNLTLKEY